MKRMHFSLIGIGILAAVTFMACNQSNIKEVKENSIYRSGKTFTYVERTVDSAMLFLEEVANYNSGNASHGFTDLIIDSVSYALTISPDQLNGQTSITGSDQQRIKDSIVDKTGRFTSRVDTTSLTDFDIIFIDISNWSLSGNTLTFHGNIGIGDMDAAYLYADCDGPEPYVDEDDWVFGPVNNYTGSCKYQNSDAAKEMEKRLNYKGSSTCRLSPCTSGQSEYFKNITTVEVKKDDGTYRNPDPNDPIDEYKDYYLWYSTWNYNTEPWACVYDDEMEFHTAGIELIGNNEKPAGKMIIGYDVIPGFYPISQFHMKGFHDVVIRYGNIGCKDI